jgi:phosphoribosylformylglycinamidine cyclo-ligase
MLGANRDGARRMPSPADSPTYEARGVSPHKPDVHRAIAGLDRGLFPSAFCQVYPDHITGDPDSCVVMHADGTGSKSLIAYFHWKETGDPSYFRAVAMDALAMNIDDMICVGAKGPFYISNTIGRNLNLVDGAVVREIIHGYADAAATLAGHGVQLVPTGGETADLGDLVRTVVVDCTAFARLRRDAVIDAGAVRPGQAIVGLSSAGQATYERAPNSGIGTNGLTAARHQLLSRRYAERFPEAFDPAIARHAYQGTCTLADPLPASGTTIGAALASPTRTYSPIVAAMPPDLLAHVSAIFHNSGGGLTKCLPFGRGVRYIKDRLFPTPPVFAFIREHARVSLREMCRVYNMGHRLEVVIDPARAGEVIAIARRFGVEAAIVGRTEPAPTDANHLVIEHESETVEFTPER